MSIIPSRYLLALSIVILFISSLSVLAIPIQQNKETTIEIERNNLKKTQQSYLGLLDTNNDKIADDLNLDRTSLDVIAIFNHDKIVPTFHEIRGISEVSRYDSIPAVNLRLAPHHLNYLTKLPGLLIIEDNKPLIPYLTRSTSQFGVRNNIWDLGYTGSSQMSIAIVDSGIDHNHSAFTNRIIASWNAIDGNSTPAFDNVGHGTHVAGIAAGAAELTNNRITSTFRSKLPESECNDRCALSLGFQIPNVLENSKITIEIDWADPGVDNPGSEVGVAIYDPLNQKTQSYITDGSGKFKNTFTVPAGSYYVGFANEASAGSQPFEATAIYDIDSSLNLDDTHPKAAGVAYNTNLVNVKVIDNNDNGDIGTFLDAGEWIINNKEKYNITVVNLSLGIDSISQSVEDMVEELVNNGIVVVTAAGNEGLASGGIYSPASSAQAIAVGSVNYINELTYYTSKGDPLVNKKVVKPDVLAPGGSFASSVFGFTTNYEIGMGFIHSADLNSGINLQSNDLTVLEGTSMASPHIAGLSSLMAQYIEDHEGWQWNAEQVYKVKRAILAGSFEIANVGVGREIEPNINVDDKTPQINRISKDFHEGWGAVDAGSIFDGMSSFINLGDNLIFNLSLHEPLANHVFIRKLVTDPENNYGIFLNVPKNVDADLYLVPIFPLDIPTSEDIGEPTFEATSTNGLGIDEKIGFSTDSSAEYWVITKIIDAPSGIFTFGLSINEVDFVPDIKITSPIDGIQLYAKEVQIEFTSVSGIADMYLNNTYEGQITSGYIKEDLDVGYYVLRLEETTSNGFTDTDEITFEIITKSTTTSSTSDFLEFYPSWMLLYIIITVTLKLIRKYQSS